MSALPVVPPGVVGRDQEWARLARVLDRGRVGRGSVLLIAGEPGIGKTRLLVDAAAVASASGAQVGHATCSPEGRPYRPWRQVLRTLGRPEVLEGTRNGPHGDPPDDTSRSVLFEAVDDALSDLAGLAPVVVVLDDLQWADPASLRLLALVGRSLAARSVVVLGAFRDGEVGPGHGLAGVVGDLGAACSVMSLGGLAPQAVGALLSGELGNVGPEVAAAVHARTGGNPFFVTEVAHAASVDRGSLDDVPPVVGEVVRRQVARCGPLARHLLEVAAVAWGANELGLVGEVLATRGADLVAPAEELCRSRLLVREGPGYRFRHDIVRDAVLAAMTVEDRARLSWAVGSVLRDRRGPGRVEEAAALLEAGVEAGDVATAVDAALAAAAAASAALGFEVAAGHLAWVVERARAGGLPRSGPDLVETLLALGEAQLNAGDWDGASRTFGEAADGARAAGRADQLARAALGPGTGLAGFEVRVGDMAQVRMLEQAVVALGDADSCELAYVLARLSVALPPTLSNERRSELAGQAVDMARRLGDQACLAHALAAWCDVIAGPAHMEERSAVAREIVDVASRAERVDLVLLGLRLQVVALLEAGDFRGADEAARSFSALAVRAAPIVRWYDPLWQGMRALLEGRAEVAVARADEAEELGRRAGSTNAALLADTLRFAVADQGGRAPEPGLAHRLATWCEAALLDDPENCQARSLALALSWTGPDLRALRDHLDSLLAADFGRRDAEWLGTVYAAGRAAILLGDREAARVVRHRLAPFGHLWLVDGIGAALYGVVEEALAALDLLITGDTGGAGAARDRLASVARMYELLPAPLLAARARRWPEVLGAARQPPGTAAAGPETGVLRRDGPVWRIGWAGRWASVADSKGMRDLARLLARPAQEVPSLELAGSMAGRSPQPTVDGPAVEAYRRRLLDLRAEIDDADEANDPERAARARIELDAIVEHLEMTLGLGGRPRAMRDEQERARQAVRARVRYAIARVSCEHPGLGRHLEGSVRTGRFCSYRPDRPVRWEVSS
ncbi:MAG: AAA family ATPase [Actinomycetota bacterium]